MPIVSVAAPGIESRYDIHIGHGLLAASAPLFAAYSGKKAVVVADTNTAPLYAETLLTSLRSAGADASLFVLPAGEPTKCPEQLLRLYDAFLDAHLTRSDVVLALGGGVGLAGIFYLFRLRRLERLDPESMRKRIRSAGA